MYSPCFSAPAVYWSFLPATGLASRIILIEQNIKKRTGPALWLLCVRDTYSANFTRVQHTVSYRIVADFSVTYFYYRIEVMAMQTTLNFISFLYENTFIIHWLEIIKQIAHVYREECEDPQTLLVEQKIWKLVTTFWMDTCGEGIGGHSEHRGTLIFRGCLL